jgi:hypothetical protein
MALLPLLSERCLGSVMTTAAQSKRPGFPEMISSPSTPAGRRPKANECGRFSNSAVLRREATTSDQGSPIARTGRRFQLARRIDNNSAPPRPKREAGRHAV